MNISWHNGSFTFNGSNLAGVILGLAVIGATLYLALEGNALAAALVGGASGGAYLLSRLPPRFYTEEEKNILGK